MTKEEFLEGSDINLVDYYLTDTIDEEGREDLVVALIVKFGDFDEQEVFLDKSDLKKLLEDIENAEENGVDYIED